MCKIKKGKNMKEVSRIVLEDDEIETLKTLADFCNNQEWCTNCIFKNLCDSFLQLDVSLKDFMEGIMEKGEL